MINFVSYEVELTLLKEMLGTNPINPNVLDRFLIERQQRLIKERNSIESAVNTYYKAKPISEERRESEVYALRNMLEGIIGPIPEEIFSALRKGDFKFKDLLSLNLEDKGITCFFRYKDKPAIGAHMILGFMKAASSAIAKTGMFRRGVVLRDPAHTISLINQHCSVASEFVTPDIDIKREESGMPAYLQRPILCATPKGTRTSLARSEQIPVGGKLTFTLQVLQGSPLTLEHLETMFSYGKLKGLGQWRNAGYGTFSFNLRCNGNN